MTGGERERVGIDVLRRGFRGAEDSSSLRSKMTLQIGVETILEHHQQPAAAGVVFCLGRECRPTDHQCLAKQTTGLGDNLKVFLESLELLVAKFLRQLIEK